MCQSAPARGLPAAWSRSRCAQRDPHDQEPRRLATARTSRRRADRPAAGIPGAGAQDRRSSPPSRVRAGSGSASAWPQILDAPQGALRRRLEIMVDQVDQLLVGDAGDHAVIRELPGLQRGEPLQDGGPAADCRTVTARDHRTPGPGARHRPAASAADGVGQDDGAAEMAAAVLVQCGDRIIHQRIGRPFVQFDGGQLAAQQGIELVDRLGLRMGSAHDDLLRDSRPPMPWQARACAPPALGRAVPAMAVAARPPAAGSGRHPPVLTAMGEAPHLSPTSSTRHAGGRRRPHRSHRPHRTTIHPRGAADDDALPASMRCARPWPARFAILRGECRSGAHRRAEGVRGRAASRRSVPPCFSLVTSWNRASHG